MAPSQRGLHGRGSATGGRPASGAGVVAAAGGHRERGRDDGDGGEGADRGERVVPAPPPVAAPADLGGGERVHVQSFGVEVLQVLDRVRHGWLPPGTPVSSASRAASAARPRLSRALIVPSGDADLAGDVVHGQVGDVVQDQCLPLGRGQLPEGRDQRDVVLARGSQPASGRPAPCPPGAGHASYAASGSPRAGTPWCAPRPPDTRPGPACAGAPRRGRTPPGRTPPPRHGCRSSRRPGR